MATLQDILISANAYLDLDATLPTGTELTTRANFADQAVKEAAAYHKFDTFNTKYTIGWTGASITLPTNFRELMFVPIEDHGNSVTRQFPEIRWEEIPDKESTDYYCYLGGNSMQGFTLTFNNLTAGTTLSIYYQRFPSGMATLSDICELLDPEYVKMKVISYVLQSRGDTRFPQADAEAQTRLANMVGRESIKNKGGLNRTPKNFSYVLGE